VSELATAEAVAILDQATQTESSIAKANDGSVAIEQPTPAATGQQEVAAETNPDGEADKPQTPEQQQLLELAKLSEERRRLDHQTQANKRQLETLRKEQGRLTELQKELDGLFDNAEDLGSLSNAIAKRRGISVDELHRRWAASLQNGGKPTAEVEQARRLERLEKELADRAKRETETQREAQQRQVVERNERWGNSVEEMLSAQESAKTWPRLMAQPDFAKRNMILSVTRQYMAENDGQLPDQASLLAYIESQLPELPAQQQAPAAKPPAGKQPRTRVATAAGASGPAGTRELTEAERVERAAALLDSMDSNG